MLMVLATTQIPTTMVCVPDGIDAFPLMRGKQSIPTMMVLVTTHSDDDGDGVLDINDAFPRDASETIDTDDDGIGNNSDTDDDGDGVRCLSSRCVRNNRHRH